MNTSDKQVIEYIDDHIKRGLSKQFITEHFIKHGWTKAAVTAAFEKHAQHKHPKKISILSIIADITKSIQRNKIAYACSLASITLFYIFLFSLSGFLFTRFSMFGVIASIVLILIAVNTFQAFVLSIMSEILDAYYKNVSIRPFSPVNATLKNIRRITLVNLLVNIIAFSPLVLGSLLVTGLALGGGNLGFLALQLLVIVVWLIWFLIVGLRYSLSPVIVIQEPRIAIRNSLGRSRKLLGTQGQVLIVIGALISSILSGIIFSTDTDNLVVVCLQLILIIGLLSYAFGGTAAIYFNRRSLRTR